MRTRSGIIGVVILSLLAACASSGDADELSEEEQEYVDAWSVALRDDDEGFPIEEGEADCMATAIMVELGTEPFEDADVTPDDIETTDSVGGVLGDGVVDDEQADTIIDGWMECVSLVDVLSESAVEEFDLGDDGATCFAAGLEEDDLMRDFLRPSFTSESNEPDEASLTVLFELVESCGGTSMVDTIAEQLAADGTLTQEQAQCLAQAIIDDVGVAGLVDPDATAAVGESLLASAESCGVDPTLIGG